MLNKDPRYFTTLSDTERKQLSRAQVAQARTTTLAVVGPNGPLYAIPAWRGVDFPSVRADVLPEFPAVQYFDANGRGLMARVTVEVRKKLDQDGVNYKAYVMPKGPGVKYLRSTT